MLTLSPKTQWIFVAPGAAAIALTISFGSEALAHNHKHVNTPGLFKKIERNLRTACPNPIPVAPADRQKCADGIAAAMADISVTVKHYVRDNVRRGSTKRRLMARADRCRDEQQDSLSNTRPSESHVQDALSVARSCLLDSIDGVENHRSVRAQINQPAQNLAIDYWNCAYNWRQPYKCDLDTSGERITPPRLPNPDQPREPTWSPGRQEANMSVALLLYKI